MKQKKAGAASSAKSISPIHNQSFLQHKDNQFLATKQPDYPIIRQHFGVQSILHSYVAQKWKGGPEI